LKHIALITAKGGNQSLPNKNLIPIGGLPSFLHAINAANKSGVISEIWVTSEDNRILDLAMDHGAKIIARPSNLAQPLTNHGDVILHAFDEISSDAEFSTMTILLGNTVMTRGSDIRATIQALEEDDDATSAMTVWEAQDDHPYRALSVGASGSLETFMQLDQQVDTNRQSYPQVLFYDQGPWTTKFATLQNSKVNRSGPGPWWWMGDRSVAVKRPWLTGRDTHTQFDLDAQEWWLSGRHSKGLA